MTRGATVIETKMKALDARVFMNSYRESDDTAGRLCPSHRDWVQAET